MTERDAFIACERLVNFLNSYTQVIEEQMASVQSSISTAFSDIMAAVQEMSEETEKGRAKADEVLESTYFNPSSETQALVEDIQGSVDDILEAAFDAEKEGVAETATSVSRLGGQFSKHMESLATMDDALGELLMDVMAALSNDDVISQRIEHISRSINALKLGLSYMLVDINSRYTLEGVRKLKEDLLDYTCRQYSSEEERVIHEKIFGKIKSFDKLKYTG